MIADIQTKEIAFAATETLEQPIIVQDADLLYVGGGCTGALF
jgi:hypothetical protein